MHSYLRAIGFRSITKKRLDEIYYETRRHPDGIYKSKDAEGNPYIEYQKDIFPGIGIAFRGTLNENNHFGLEYYFPYLKGSTKSTNVPVEIIKGSDRECIHGLCDDLKLGVELIFFLQDMLPLMSSDFVKSDTVSFGGVMLGALAIEGKILFPVKKSVYQMERVQKQNAQRAQLLSAARDGDEEAIEQLTISDMDLYAYVSKRAEREDILSIVNTYFMPNGIESDKYSILGEILDYKKITNQFTSEEIYVMTISCNYLQFDVCINEKDLLGEPAVGRRIKCKIWMQGFIQAH